MPQLCRVCTHPKSRELDLALLRHPGKKRKIAQAFNVGEASIYRHVNSCLSERLERALAKAEERRELDIRTELLDCFAYAAKLRRACDTWLTDPENPAEYTLDARDEEIDVIYKAKIGEREDGTPVYERKRAKLSRLLRQIEDEDTVVERGEAKHSDPRKLILESLDRFDKHLRMLGDLTGAFVAPATNPADIKREQIIAFHQQINFLVAGSPEKANQLARLLLLPATEFLDALEGVGTDVPLRHKDSAGLHEP